MVASLTSVCENLDHAMSLLCLLGTQPVHVQQLACCSTARLLSSMCFCCRPLDKEPISKLDKESIAKE